LLKLSSNSNPSMDVCMCLAVLPCQQQLLRLQVHGGMAAATACSCHAMTLPATMAAKAAAVGSPTGAAQQCRPEPASSSALLLNTCPACGHMLFWPCSLSSLLHMCLGFAALRISCGCCAPTQTCTSSACQSTAGSSRVAQQRQPTQCDEQAIVRSSATACLAPAGSEGDVHLQTPTDPTCCCTRWHSLH
jgi:hypothetical protein